jgi:hypothetical protein
VKGVTTYYLPLPFFFFFRFQQALQSGSPAAQIEPLCKQFLVLLEAAACGVVLSPRCHLTVMIRLPRLSINYTQNTKHPRNATARCSDLALGRQVCLNRRQRSKNWLRSTPKEEKPAKKIKAYFNLRDLRKFFEQYGVQ